MRTKILLGAVLLVAAALVASVVLQRIAAKRPHVSIQSYDPVDLDSHDRLKLLRFDLAGRGSRTVKFRLLLLKAGQSSALGNYQFTGASEPVDTAPHTTISGMDPAGAWEGDIFVLLERTSQTENRGDLLKCRSRCRLGGASLIVDEQIPIDRDVKLGGSTWMSEPELAPSKEIPVATYYYSPGNRSPVIGRQSLSELEEQSKKTEEFIFVLTAQWE